jgi:hypothetical protein
LRFRQDRPFTLQAENPDVETEASKETAEIRNQR